MDSLFARVVLVLLPAFSFCACDVVPKAPQGSPRVEVEVTVSLDDSYGKKLKDVGAELGSAIADMVLSRADLGLRFYPVPSAQYQPNDPRPEYLMSVEVGSLDIILDHRTVQMTGTEPAVVTVVSEIGCTATATVTKRRANGPPLMVGRTTGRCSWSASTSPDTPSPEPRVSYVLNRENSDKQPLMLPADDLLRAAEKGVASAFSSLVVPVDRELSLRGPNRAAQAAEPQ